MRHSAAQAARLAGCSTAQLRYWRRAGLVGAADVSGYDFTDLVALRIVRSLLDAGLSTARIRAALDALRAAGDDVTTLRLVTDGQRVWACHDDGQILDALRAGQLALFLAVDRVAADVDADVRAFTEDRDAFVARLVTGDGRAVSSSAAATG